MLCLYPINNIHACGQCTNCRINRQRIWTSRILLESFFHRQSTFITITYDDDNCPITPTGQMNLEPADLKKFLKRYKRDHSHIRYFACAEYGDQSQRPHYHAIIFGHDPYEAETEINKIWTKGFNTVGELTPERAAYIAQYTVKKLQKDHRDLGDRHPEFIRTSREKFIGAIGVPAIPWLGNLHKTIQGRKQLLATRDVWTSVRIYGKILPLGGFMRIKLREYLGLPKNSYDRQKALGGTNFEVNLAQELSVLPGPIESVNGAKKQYEQAQDKIEAQPDLQSKEAKRFRAARRNQAVRI